MKRLHADRSRCAAPSLALAPAPCFAGDGRQDRRSTSCRPRWCATCTSATHSSITTRARTSRRSRACRPTAQWGRMPHHDAETDLLLGGLYLSLGLHNEAGERFETLLTQSVPEGVRNRAWFYLGKIWYARGYLDRAERAIKEVQGRLHAGSRSRAPAPAQQHPHAPAALRRSHRAARTPGRAARIRATGSPTRSTTWAWRWCARAWSPRPIRSSPPSAPSSPAAASCAALRDRANLALGYAYLQNNQPALAKPVLAARAPRRSVLEQGLARRGLGGRRRRPVPGRRSRPGWSCATATCSTPPCRKPISRFRTPSPSSMPTRRRPRTTSSPSSPSTARP